MHADHRYIMDSRGGNHRNQHLLPQHRLRGLVNPQQSTQSCKCVRWDLGVSLNGHLHPCSHLLNCQKRHCCNFHRANKERLGRPERNGKWDHKHEWTSCTFQRGFGRHSSTRIEGYPGVTDQLHLQSELRSKPYYIFQGFVSNYIVIVRTQNQVN